MSKIFDCQDKLVSLLTADPFFTDLTDPAHPVPIVPVMSQRVGNIPAAVAAALQKISVGVIVMLPLITFPDNETPALLVGLKFAIVVTENPLLNKTGKAAEAIVEKILVLTHWKQNGVDLGEATLCQGFIIDQNAVRQMPPPASQPQILAYTISINTEVSIT